MGVELVTKRERLMATLQGLRLDSLANPTEVGLPDASGAAISSELKPEKTSNPKQSVYSYTSKRAFLPPPLRVMLQQI